MTPISSVIKGKTGNIQRSAGHKCSKFDRNEISASAEDIKAMSNFL